MLQWIIIGAVIWYFYRRHQAKKRILRQRNARFIHRNEPSDPYHNSSKNRYYKDWDQDEDYIDYEEIN